MECERLRFLRWFWRFGRGWWGWWFGWSIVADEKVVENGGQTVVVAVESRG